MKKLLLIVLLFAVLFAAEDVYVLCEGGYTSTNSSLWYYNGEEVEGPVAWGINENPLGSTGQSLCYDNNKLFIVMNGSNSIEVLNTNTKEELASIPLDGAGPREMDVYDSKGYVSCWYLQGIIVFDLETYTLLDTLSLGFCPEDIIIEDGILYTCDYMDVMYSVYGEKVLSFDISSSEPTAIDTFIVAGGAQHMLITDTILWVASTDWDASWNTIPGMSKINLTTKEVEIKQYDLNAPFSEDISIINDSVYRSYGSGVVKINDDLSYDPESAIGNINGSLYSFAANEDKIYLGYSDYTAPDTVAVLDSEGNQVDEIILSPEGAIPGSFAFVPKANSAEEFEQVAENFQLKQNYPNPFNPSTNIQYNIPKNAFVKLAVYNILGKHIIDLVNSNQVSGLKNVQWNAIDKNGVAVPTGVYFYRLEAGDVNLTRKMILMK